MQRIIVILFAPILLFATSASDFYKEQMQGFQTQKKEFVQYKKKELNSFEAYKKAQLQAYKEYKKEIGIFWKQPKLSTKKEWVSYSKDKKTRSEIDFEKNEIVVETIATNPKEAIRKLKMTLAKVVVVDTKTAIENDPLEQKIAKIPAPSTIVNGKPDTKPILAPVIFSKKPTKKSVASYVNNKVSPQKIKKQPSKLQGAMVYQIKIKLPKDTTYKRSTIYLHEVQQNAFAQKLPVDLVFAIIHTESSFNPKATSYVPAYGLMQIVPRTAGIDSYYYLYKKRRMPSSHYLYNSQNNIKLGTAYLHLLYYGYLKKIQNPKSRLYCTIAAYNTGAGNVAWAFTHTYNPSKAAKVINRLTPSQVYNRLLRDLRYDEPKHYLKRVTKRIKIYHKVYIACKRQKSHIASLPKNYFFKMDSKHQSHPG